MRKSRAKQLKKQVLEDAINYAHDNNVQVKKSAVTREYRKLKKSYTQALRK